MSESAPQSPVDVEKLAEAVYRLWRGELRLDRTRRPERPRPKGR